MGRPKIRLDILLVDRGLCNSREKAKAAIMTGHVLVGGQRVDKPGCLVEPEAELEVRGELPYVGRGGLKLEKAIQEFNLDLRDKIVLDVGASTGGFTDCVLQHGARLVYAVDVGYGQLAWKLRCDPRVISLERTNIRYLSREAIDVPPDVAVIDVSFISLIKILPKIGELTTQDAQSVALIKPQFEAGPQKVGRKGVVRDPHVHREVITRVYDSIVDSGWGIRGLDFSPIKGPKGNIEYLIYFIKNEPTTVRREECIPLVIEKAHAFLD